MNTIEEGKYKCFFGSVRTPLQNSTEERLTAPQKCSAESCCAQESCMLSLVIQKFTRTPAVTHFFTKVLPLPSKSFPRLVTTRAVDKDSN